MSDVVKMQSFHCSDLDNRKLCSFDLELIEGPTKPLIHQASRFLYINRGKGKILIQNIEYELKLGAFIAILPWEISEVTEVQIPLQYYILVYHFDTLNEIIKSLYNTNNEPIDILQTISSSSVVYCNRNQEEKVRGIFLTIRDEVGIESTMERVPPKKLSNVYVTNQLIELIILFERIGKKDQSKSGEKQTSVDRNKIFRYIYTHLNEKLTLKMLSKIFYMSESSVSLYISQITGLSFLDLINEMRVGKTINFLIYTDFTLEELAEILGYVDASHISKVFAARIGLKANEYRKTYQQMNDICKVKESRKAYAVVSYIYRRSQDQLSAQKVAAQFGISVMELHRILMYQVEQNFENFLNFVRINQACELLLKTDKSITDIAIEVGYNTVKTFTRNFLKFKVMTPSAFRGTVSFQKSKF